MKTKAQTLQLLKNSLTEAKILDLVVFTVIDWRYNPGACLSQVIDKFGKETRLIIRSSTQSEDQAQQSNAGRYESLLDISMENLSEAIEKVIGSFGQESHGQDEILIQPMLCEAAISGVMFTQDPNMSAPYYIINYEMKGNTQAVTSGNSSGLETKIIARCNANISTPDPFHKLIRLAKELEATLSSSALDIEFAFDGKENLYLFQVRPLIMRNTPPSHDHKNILKQIADKFDRLNNEHPYLHGKKTVLGVMPDWNPAEIIGIRPKPLALSLYKELITDSTWAYQRDNYGYKNLRSFPLLIDLMGLPYIDVRVSFNSFIPKELSQDLSDRLVDYYLDRLIEDTTLHDKIEFDIAYSCYTFDILERITKLEEFKFSKKDTSQIIDSLKRLTNRIIHRDNGMWIKDTQKVEELKTRHDQIFFNSDFDVVTKIYWLIEDCKRYGTLPFAGLARAAFIAVQILNSMVAVGVLSPEQRLAFLNSLDSVSTQMTNDLHILDKQHFLQKYGHLRPGTYDILSPRYDEAPNLYFDWSNITKSPTHGKTGFQLSLTQMQKIEALLVHHGLEHDVVGLFTFMKEAIEGREYSKFVFTKTLSNILSLIKELGFKYNISVEDISCLDIQTILKLQTSSWNEFKELSNCIESGKQKYSLTSQIILPPVIKDSRDVWSFSLPENKPSFITRKSLTANVVRDLLNVDDMKGAIIFIPSADPGFDWIFTHNIAGFITAYGGTNSHMAIRAGELGLPAVIGAGEKLYQQWVSASKIHIDCLNQRVEIIH